MAIDDMVDSSVGDLEACMIQRVTGPSVVLDL